MEDYLVLHSQTLFLMNAKGALKSESSVQIACKWCKSFSENQ